jgi:hypothetical protein
MERRNAMRAAMLPGRDPEVTNSFRRYIDDLLAPRDPTRQYGAILPISSDPNVPGSGRFDLRGGFTGDILGMLGAGGRAMRGEAYDPMDITTGLIGTATPSLAARPSASTARVFGGENAQGVQNAFWRARDWLNWTTPENVHRRTGVFRSPEGRLMFEIDDSAARLRTENLGPPAYGVYQVPMFPKTPLTVGDVLEHPELYSRYPQVAQTPLRSTGFNFDIRGAYNPDTNKMFLASGHADEMRSAFLHEIQHNVQKIEKFAQGGNPQQFLAADHAQIRKENNALLDGLRNAFKTDGIDINEYILQGAIDAENAGKKLMNFQRDALNAAKNHPLWDDLKLAVQNNSRLIAAEAEAFRKYEALPGERMARTVEERRDMTAEQRRAGGIPRIVD